MGHGCPRHPEPDPEASDHRPTLAPNTGALNVATPARRPEQLHGILEVRIPTPSKKEPEVKKIPVAKA